jgi:hypothetical protein
MTQTHVLINHYVLGTAKKVALFVVAAVKFVARLKGRWYERTSG